MYKCCSARHGHCFSHYRSSNTVNIFLQLVSQHCCIACKLKHSVARITTFVTNLSRSKIQCCKLRQHVAQSRLEFYFLRQILALLLVLPLKLPTCLATNLNSKLVTGFRKARQRCKKKKQKQKQNKKTWRTVKTSLNSK